MNFKEQLIFLRRQRGLSQEQLGNQIGVSRQTVSKWELGETTPELEKLLALSKLFDVSIDELTGNARYSQKVSEPNISLEQTIRPDDERHVTYDYIPVKHYEYKSKRRLFGMPLVHINYGHGLYKARGVIAIGNIADGILSLGCLSAGLISIGLVSVGLLSLGVLSVALLFSMGVFSLGSISFGSFSFGIIAVGALSFGTYSIGAYASASHIAFGAFAKAPIAIGEEAVGGITFLKHAVFTAQEVRDAIMDKFPHTWSLIANIFADLAEAMRNSVN
jgi:transcriptional regulator with XRE-family HTH domain